MQMMTGKSSHGDGQGSAVTQAEREKQSAVLWTLPLTAGGFQ